MASGKALSRSAAILRYQKRAQDKFSAELLEQLARVGPMHPDRCLLIGPFVQGLSASEQSHSGYMS